MQSIMSIISQVAVALLILSGLIIIHEGGHFLFAKLTGIKVLEFSLFMGPKLFSKKGKETEYSIRAIPIGGFVKMEGEESRSDDKRAFNNKPIWVRMLVVAGGPAVNILYAITIYALISYIVLGYCPSTVVSEIMPNSAAETAGIKAGDKILKMDDEKIYTFSQINIHTMQADGNEMHITLYRNGIKHEILITPKYSDENKRYMIGIKSLRRTDLFGFIGYGVNHSIWFSKMTFKQIGLILVGKESVSTLAGPVGIVTEIGKATVQEPGETVQDVLIRLLSFSAMISLSLGILNLLPIPALDGSKLAIVGVEGIRKKPIPPKIEAYISAVGFAFLIMLIIFVTINDLRRLYG